MSEKLQTETNPDCNTDHNMVSGMILIRLGKKWAQMEKKQRY